MNEVTRIHLGRQPYTISVEAYAKLKDYLADIQKNVGDPEVANEVELRMSELLTERGVTADKAILSADIVYLQEQLGSPADFSDDAESSDAHEADTKTTKRLFRDTDQALVAGVAAGLANYLGIDALLVRIAFILLTIFSGGVGILVYILLWVLVPTAETASEKLQMRGKPVTLEALKESVEKADVATAARRVNNKMTSVINGVMRVVVKLTGLGFIATGLGIIATVAVAKMYMLLHNGQLFQENLFPVGIREEWLVILCMLLAVITAVFFILTGIATFKHKWPLKAWTTAVLAGLFFIGSAVGMALAADAAPRVQERYESLVHTTVIDNIQPFTKVATTGNVNITYTASPSYAVTVHHTDRPDLSKLKINTSNDTLYIDSSALDDTKHCTMLCLFPDYNMTVEIYTPNADNLNAVPANEDVFYTVQ